MPKTKIEITGEMVREALAGTPLAFQPITVRSEIAKALTKMVNPPLWSVVSNGRIQYIDGGSLLIATKEAVGTTQAGIEANRIAELVCGVLNERGVELY